MPEDRISAKDIRKIRNCMIFDSYPLMVFLVGKYIENNPNKSFILRKEDENILKCINQIISNYRINKIHITSNIFSEFINHIRNFYKNNYKEIKQELIDDLNNLEEIYINKNKIIKHQGFIDFGNDVSIVIATDEKIKCNESLSIVSKDGRFLEYFYADIKSIYCFNLDTLQYFYL